MPNCPICNLVEAAVEPLHQLHAKAVTCGVCGKVRIDELFIDDLEARLSTDPQSRARFVHWLRKRTHPQQPMALTRDLFETIIRAPLPAPREQADNLIRWLGDSLRVNPGGTQRIPMALVAPTIGASNAEGLIYVIRELRDAGQLYPPGGTPSDALGLTFRGWDRYDELQRSHAEGPIAFMAMPFNQALLERVFTECFVPAVRRAGFELRRIIDNQPAGLIDDQLRVAIRKAKFLISELTQGNPGAYWEAGYAEGLGKPVIYTCQKSFFENAATKPHFDANHCVTVIWDDSELQEAGRKLTTTIRATLPGEARMSDDNE